MSILALIGIFNAAAVVHLARIAPRGTETTAQGLLRGVQQGLGGALGTLAGGWGYAKYGLQGMYLYWSLAIVPFAVLIWILGWIVGSDVGRPSSSEKVKAGNIGRDMSVGRYGGLVKDDEALYNRLSGADEGRVQ